MTERSDAISKADPEDAPPGGGGGGGEAETVSPQSAGKEPPKTVPASTAPTAAAEEDDDQDDARPEATFRYRVERFSQLKESALSPVTMVRNLPWRIMVMPRVSEGTRSASAAAGHQAQKSLGYFLQCNGESESSSWSCQAQAELRLLRASGGGGGSSSSSSSSGQPFVRKISHLFYSKENDWGFSHYLAWDDVVDPEQGHIKDDVVTFEVKVTADAPHGVCWDSKKHTGYVGLKNQGATCYMNSLLQVLFFTNALRKCVYKMPTEADDSAKSVALALQRVFYDLQFMDKSVGTKKLTKSFGWETLDTFMQHDAQEFLRVLLDKLEHKMKGTCVAGTIPKLIEGKTISYIKCKNVDYTSSRTETFYDIQLNVKGFRTIMESFRHYVKTENLDGENKYDAGSHGLQDAEKGIVFERFPPILHLHLMRFQYDSTVDSSVKYNDRFEFTDTLDLSEFTKMKDESLNKLDAMEVDHDDTEANSASKDSGGDSDVYVLHAVLVHSGDNHGGHYVVFINPNCDGKWCKFDDDVVSRCTSTEAIQNNFGGGVEDGSDVTVAGRQSTNAYMLVYIRKSVLREVLCEVSRDDIPAELESRLQEEKKVEMIKRREKSEAHLYMTVRLLLEDAFFGHQGNDLFDQEKAAAGTGGGLGAGGSAPSFGAMVYHEVRVRKQEPLREVMQLLSAQMRVPVEKLRLWPMNRRTNQTFRPSLADVENCSDRSIIEVADNQAIFTAFLEVERNPEASSLPHFDKEHDVMLFFKYYDPAKEKIHYMGHMYVSIASKVSAMVPELLRRANLPDGTPLLLFEEIQPNMVDRIEDIDKPLEHVLEELMDGDIVVFQRDPFRSGAGSPSQTLNNGVDQQHAWNAAGSESKYRLATSREYFRDLFFRVDVIFVDKNVPSDPGFTLTLSQRTNYEQMVEAVARHLNVDPVYLQFFKTQTYREVPGSALRCTFDGTLKDLLVILRPRHPKKMFYQRLTIPIHELENKRQFKCVWMSADQKDEKELTLYPNRNGRIQDILEEAKQHVSMDPGGSGQLRMLDIISHKIYNVNKPDMPIEGVANTNTKSYRIEEVPLDQVSVAEDEMIVPVAHFQREAYSTFGNPFLIKIKEDEAFESVKERIRTHLDVPEKDFEKYKLALVQNSKLHFLEEDNIDRVKLKDFAGYGGQHSGSHMNAANVTSAQQNHNHHARPFIGLQHQNKNSKRARYNYMEKAIKIYN